MLGRAGYGSVADITALSSLQSTKLLAVKLAEGYGQGCVSQSDDRSIWLWLPVASSFCPADSNASCLPFLGMWYPCVCR